MLERVWVVTDQVFDDTFITVCRTRAAAVDVAAGIIKDYYEGAGESTVMAFLKESRKSEGSMSFCYYGGGGVYVSIDLREVIG